MAVDFDSNRLICVHYPPGSGGKFLMNCLALTPVVEFQRSDLLNFFTTSEQRYNFLLNKLKQVNGKWDDLNLGCIEMLYVAPYYDLDLGLIRQQLSEHPVLLNLKSSNRYWCMAAHKDIDVDNLYRKIWPNCQIVRFTNYKKFLLARDYKYNNNSSGRTYPGEYIWDVDVCYSSKYKFSYELNKLCDWLNIPNVDTLYLEKLYTLWIEKINLQV